MKHDDHSPTSSLVHIAAAFVMLEFLLLTSARKHTSIDVHIYDLA